MPKGKHTWRWFLSLFPGGLLYFEITTFEIVTKKGQVCLRENIRGTGFYPYSPEGFFISKLLLLSLFASYCSRCLISLVTTLAFQLLPFQ